VNNATVASTSLEQDRLVALIEFAKESAKLRAKPASTVAQHGVFALWEHEVQGRPGITLNLDRDDDADEVWLEVKRLHETRPLEPKSAVLKPWVELAKGPDAEPRLRLTVEGAALIAAGTHRSTSQAPRKPEEGDLPEIEPDALLPLDGYDQEPQVRSQFNVYVENIWRPWAEEERRRRWTIRLYGQLFTLKQQLEGSFVESQIELTWGCGMGIWASKDGSISYPLVTRTVELTLNPETQSIEISPRDVDPRLEVDWYAAMDNAGLAQVEKTAKDFFGKATITFSPFDRGTFEPLLRSAVTYLDPQGSYWPETTAPEDRTLPKADDKLKVTDTWVLFARPRTNSVLLQDLENLKKEVEAKEDASDLPVAVAALVTEPATENVVIELPTFRGVSASYHGISTESTGGAKPKDLYFPKPFNDEQVRIVQLLEVSEGVAVQGPPGTGKTHTIANVICHYLANGRRVLVTSMKDPALAVLQDQLPTEIRPLAISLLTSEQDGMKQFEHAIHKIASEVQSLDQSATERVIEQLEDTIDALHAKLARVDRATGDWAQKNLERVRLDDEEIDPQDAAHEVVDNMGQYEWIPDHLGVGPENTPQFANADVVALRDARRTLGPDMAYLGCSLPQLADFPDSRQLLQVHQDLSRFSVLTKGIEDGDVPPLADSSQETLAAAQALVADIEQLRQLRDEVIAARRPWTVGIRDTLRGSGQRDLIGLFEALGAELKAANDERKAVLHRPVVTPPNMESDAEMMEAIRLLAIGKRPFGAMGFVGKSGQKMKLGQITVLGSPPKTQQDWSHVARCLALQKRLRELALRWNALAPELKVERVNGAAPEHGLECAGLYGLYLKVKAVVVAESKLQTATTAIFPNWLRAREIAINQESLAELDAALRHHLTKNRLADVWALKERFQKVLEARSGPVVTRIRDFLADTLGNSAVGDADMQAEWSVLMAELVRVLGLGQKLHTVAQVTERIEASGAPELARKLRQPLIEAIDASLPDNWKQTWRFRRLATYLEAIDAQEELKKLAKERFAVDTDLSRAYQEIVIKRTWLALAKNASPSIRAALQAYLAAIQKIGKGTGKRAVRYRQDARAAARKANPAVPCWIMPHYRVSESLPPELGCFDLVIVDEASQSDLSALPALLRAEKVLIVGDDKQVSPEGVGLEEEKVRSLMSRFLGNQVETYRPQMSPERSIYDLYKVVFARSAVMLKEHFRCVSPIIEYSKREFYNHELQPLRIPRASERIDPPLVDVLVEDGYRNGKVNRAEAQFIVEEVGKLIADPRMSGRSIGVVSLLGDEQALEVWKRLNDEYGPEVLERFHVTCGDARTFQGKERHVMFLTMVAAPNEIGGVLSRDTFAQRFNVAASRARDRMYLVRSVEAKQLSEADLLRRNLIHHFSVPFAQDEDRVEDLRKLCESPFEREVYDDLTGRGYWITPQVRVGQYRIDMVVQGHNDARLAIECDGDKYHGPDKWADDMQRQRVLERAGWVFWRCFASTFVRRRDAVIKDLLTTLTERGVEPIGADGAPQSVHAEQRRYSTTTSPLNGGPVLDDDEGTAETPKPAAPNVPSTFTTILDAIPRFAQTSPPSPGSSIDQLADLLNSHRLKSEDLRSRGGSLWVYATDNDHKLRRALEGHGFKFARGRGWWKKS
jgi:very-short-patch-repair endonuclease